jgi:hypothetical protein
MRYGLRLGCRFGQAHEFETVKETSQFKVERCKICGIRKKYNIGYKSRSNNIEYLKDHVRNFAQKGGATNRVFLKIYEPEKIIIYI